MIIKLVTVEDEAEHLTMQRLLERYLSPETSRLWTIQDASVTARQIGNRYGVPADASTWLYRIQHPNLAWTVDVRAVWRCRELLRPRSTHVAITSVWNDNDIYENLPATRAAFRDWLRALPFWDVP